MSGTIVVDGVLASSHSDWFLDSEWSEAIGLTPHLPDIYQVIPAFHTSLPLAVTHGWSNITWPLVTLSPMQVVLAPVRGLYLVLGPEKYARLWDWVDSRLDISDVGIRYGGLIIGVSLAAAFAIVLKGSMRMAGLVVVRRLGLRSRSL